MKALIIRVGLSAAALAAAGPALGLSEGQMPKYGVTVTAEKDVDFAKLKTYTWMKGQPSSVPEIDSAVIAAVDRELRAIGMTKALSGAGDVLVTYSSLSRTDVDLNAKAARDGTRTQYAVGTLVVALLEPGSLRRLLRLRIDEPIETDLAKLVPTIDGVVASMFARYPARHPK
jgi:hypothetical protein